MFSPFGEVAAAHVFTAGEKRFAFVLMMNEADAESAIEAAKWREFFGRELWFNGRQNSGRSDAPWPMARCSLIDQRKAKFMGEA